jgi:hypothetical protein
MPALRRTAPFLVVLWLAPQLAAQNIVVNGYNSSRTQAGASFPDGAAFERARTNLRDAAFFGSGGVVNRPVLIGAGVTAATEGILSGANIFVTGSVASSTYTSAERSAIQSAVNQGMSLVITAEDPSHDLSDLFGVTLTSAGAEMSTAAQPDHPIFSGPFGRITQFRGAAPYGSFRSWPAGTQVLATSSAGPTILLIPRGTLATGSGAVLLLADLDILSTTDRNLDANSTEPSIPVTDALVLNVINFLANPSATAVAPSLVFPQIAHGDGNASSLVLTNASSTTILSTNIAFRDDSGNPLSFSLAGEGSTSGFIVANIGPNQTLTYNTVGSATLRSGAAFVSSSPLLGGIVLFQVPGLGVTGVGSSDQAGGFDLPIVPGPSASSGTGIDIPPGVALVNLSAKSSTIRLELWDVGGRRSDGVTTITLPARGHTARYLFQLYPNFNFAGFKGTLRVVSRDGLIAVTALQLGNVAGQFNALPVKPLFR